MDREPVSREETRMDRDQIRMDKDRVNKGVIRMARVILVCQVDKLVLAILRPVNHHSAIVHTTKIPVIQVVAIRLHKAADIQVNRHHIHRKAAILAVHKVVVSVDKVRVLMQADLCRMISECNG